jgi:hypothetical protein
MTPRIASDEDKVGDHRFWDGDPYSPGSLKRAIVFDVRIPTYSCTGMIRAKAAVAERFGVP